MEQFTFKLADFEGPLDLLLYLVSKNKMSLADIEIVKLIDQYVSIVHGVRAEEMEGASEFIEMAARLVQMKSFFLLPKSEEAERMREELTGMLVEYSLCKEVAAKLRAMGEGIYLAVRGPMPVELDATYRLCHQPCELEKAYNAAGQKPFEAHAKGRAVRAAYRRAHGVGGLAHYPCAARPCHRQGKNAAAAFFKGRHARPDGWPPFWPCWSWCAQAV